MFCPSCGEETVAGLKYCKRCGSNLATTSLDARPQVTITRPSGVAWAMAFASTAIGLGGLGMTIAAVSSLIRPEGMALTTPTGGTIAISIVMLVLGSLTTVTIVTILIRLLSRVLGLGSETRAQTVPRAAIPESRQPSLYPPPLPPVQIPTSVTEHTTRNFEPRAYEPGARE